ncbi:AAA family ATPase [Litorilituus lipolyticus]|nr:AAA family ATPase [Litorilituus lipolyticus]
MKYINRNNKAIEVSTTELHFDELNNFPIEVIVETINFWVPTLTFAKAIKYADWQSILNLFYYTECLDDAFFNETPPFGLLDSSTGESVLAQNKILKKLRQVQSVMLSKGQYSARTKRIASLDNLETTKILTYRTEILRDTLHNASYEDCVAVMAAINGNDVGDEVLKLILKSKEDIEYFMLQDMRNVTDDKALSTINTLREKLEYYAREPWHIGHEPVNRSNEAIIERKFVKVVGEACDELKHGCREMPNKHLAKILIAINDELKNAFYGLLSDDYARELKVAVANLESDIFNKWKSRSFFKNKSESDVTAFIQKQHNYNCQRAYRPLCRLENFINSHQLVTEEPLPGAENDAQTPLSFTQLANYQDSAIRYMLRLAHTDDLLAAFYYCQSAPELKRIYNIVPTMKRRFEQAYLVHDVVPTEQAVQAQLKLINLLECAPEVPKPDLKKQPIQTAQQERLEPKVKIEPQQLTKAIYNKAALEEVLLLRDATGEHGAEAVRKVLDKGPTKTVLIATQRMLDEMEGLAQDFPNLAEPIEEILICLKLSLFNQSAIEFPVINLQSVPGCGKTEFIRSLACRLGLEFFDQSVSGFGGKQDLIGGSSQFKSSNIGAIAESVLVKASTAQPIVLLDEICLARPDIDHSIVPSLLGLFDIEQRKSVKEQFLDVEMDLSSVLFFTTTNNYENLIPAIKSRLKNYDIQPPSQQQMRTICQNIYTNYLTEKNFQHFKEKLNERIIDLLSELTPREAKIAVISGIRRAFVRATNRESLIEVELQDVSASRGSSCERKPAGFIH